MQRDLGLDATTARQRLADESRAAAVEQRVVPALGAHYGGSWFDATSGELVVGVTDEAHAGQARAAGARTRTVRHSQAALDAVKAELDELAVRRPASVAGVTGWRVDPVTNRVLVTLIAGRAPGELVGTARRHGDAVAFETTDAEAVAATDWVDGGELITTAGKRCSIGFNARLTYSDLPGVSDPVVISAGHCAADDGSMVFAYGGSSAVGLSLGRWWLRDYTRDWGVVGVTDRDYWVQGPWIALQTATDDYLEVRGALPQPIGGSVCKSGMTTKITCGVIRARNESVVQSDTGRTVTGLTRHTACVEKGDSGGSNYSGVGQAQGVTSTAVLRNDSSGRARCLAAFGEESRSWYVEISYIQGYTGARILTV